MKRAPDTWEKITMIASGGAFILLLLILALAVPDPTEFQEFIFRVVLALSAASFGCVIPGFLNISSNNLLLSLRAGGALALFVFIYSSNPPKIIERFSLRPLEVKAESNKEQKAFGSATNALSTNALLTNALTDLNHITVDQGTKSRNAVIINSPGATIIQPDEYTRQTNPEWLAEATIQARQFNSTNTTFTHGFAILVIDGKTHGFFAIEGSSNKLHLTLSDMTVTADGPGRVRITVPAWIDHDFRVTSPINFFPPATGILSNLGTFTPQEEDFISYWVGARVLEEQDGMPRVVVVGVRKEDSRPSPARNLRVVP